MKNKNLDNLLQMQRGHLDKLSAIVREAIEEEELIVNKVANPEQEKTSVVQKIADWITWFSGSMQFLALNAFLFIAWIFFNFPS